VASHPLSSAFALGFCLGIAAGLGSLFAWLVHVMDNPR
jgi:hypothetical protein